MKGVSLHQKWDFASENDEFKDTDKAARFKLKALDAFQVASLNDGIMRFEGITKNSGNDEAKINMGRVALEAIQMSLIEVENFDVQLREDGPHEPLQLKFVRKVINGRAYQVVRDEDIAHFPSTLLQEMYTFLSEKNGMTAEEAKKSASR